MIRTPMRKVMQPAGSFRPAYAGPRTPDERVILDAIGRLEGEFFGLMDDIRGMYDISLRANKTGRRIEVRARRAGGRLVRFTVAPYEGIDDRQRTPKGLLSEVFGSLARRQGLFKLVADEARDVSGEKKYFSHSMVSRILLREALASLPPDEGGPQRLHDAVRAFVSAGGHLGNFDEHQRTKAMEAFRSSALHAMRHGSRLEDLIAAVHEEMVRATMDG